MSTAKAEVGLRRDVAMVFFVVAVFILAIAYSVFSATTISDNISTGGTLSVSGNSSVAQLSSSTNIYATSTLQATGNILGYNKLGIGTTTPGTALSVHAANTLLGGPTTIYGPLNLAYLNATSTTASYFSGNLGVGTTTPGTALSVHAANTLLGGPTTIYGPLNLAYLNATSTTASYFTGALGIGTTTPGATLAVNGPGIFVGTSTVFGGLNLESISATGTLGFYTRGTAAPRLIIDSSGNLGVATSGPATTLSTVGSGYFTAGLGVGYATTGSGNLLVNDLAVVRGRAGVNATTSPSQELGVLGDVHLGLSAATASTTITVESGGVRAGCIELRGSTGSWVSIYAGAGSATSTTATVIGTRNQFQGGDGTGILVIAQGRCDDTD